MYELPPGQSICPYHYEYAEEEWLLVLHGRPTLRHPGGADELEPWDVVCFPPGPAATVYPDSDNIAVWTGNRDDDLIVHRTSGVDYWSGEAGS